MPLEQQRTFLPQPDINSHALPPNLSSMEEQSSDQPQPQLTLLEQQWTFLPRPDINSHALPPSPAMGWQGSNMQTPPPAPPLCRLHVRGIRRHARRSTKALSPASTAAPLIRRSKDHQHSSWLMSHVRPTHGSTVTTFGLSALLTIQPLHNVPLQNVEALEFGLSDRRPCVAIGQSMSVSTNDVLFHS